MLCLLISSVAHTEAETEVAGSPAVGTELESESEGFVIPADKEHRLAARSPQSLEDETKPIKLLL